MPAYHEALFAALVNSIGTGKKRNKYKYSIPRHDDGLVVQLRKS